MKARQEFVDKSLNSAFKSFYAGFLTDEEMQDIIKGHDLWLSAPEVRERWNSKIGKTKSTIGEEV